MINEVFDAQGNPVRPDGTALFGIEYVQPGEKYIAEGGVAFPLAKLTGQYREKTNTYYDPAIHVESKVYTKANDEDS